MLQQRGMHTAFSGFAETIESLHQSALIDTLPVCQKQHNRHHTTTTGKPVTEGISLRKRTTLGEEELDFPHSAC